MKNEGNVTRAFIDSLRQIAADSVVTGRLRISVEKEKRISKSGNAALAGDEKRAAMIEGTWTRASVVQSLSLLRGSLVVQNRVFRSP